MRKPLLTDDMIEEARPKQRLDMNFGYHSPHSEYWEEEDDYGYDDYDEYAEYEEDDDYDDDYEEWDDEYEGYQEGQTIRIPVEQSIVKSRRIETMKREAFRQKVNKILFWIVLLVILLIVAVLTL